MNMVEGIAELIGTSDVWTDHSNVHWFATGKLNLRDVARKMKDCHARFVTITATQLPRDEGLCLDYLWDLDGQLLGFAFYLSNHSIESIYDICEAADWIEREVHEGFGIDFLGREYEPLLLREGQKPGMNLREEVK